MGSADGTNVGRDKGTLDGQLLGEILGTVGEMDGADVGRWRAYMVTPELLAITTVVPSPDIAILTLSLTYSSFLYVTSCLKEFRDENVITATAPLPPTTIVSPVAEMETS